MVLRSSNLTSVINNSTYAVFSIMTLLFTIEEFIAKYLFLNNKQGLNADLNETWRHPNSKILFYNDYRHDLIMNFLLNSFQSKSNKFMMEPTVFIGLAETPLSHRRLFHNRGLYSCLFTIYFYRINKKQIFIRKQIWINHEYLSSVCNEKKYLGIIYLILLFIFINSFCRVDENYYLWTNVNKLWIIKCLSIL